ncbi:prepilin peptidase [Candidatus Blastococcus massiliensis]|uniref:prepilin peptidase n=1 Tax=Candidatus Blastococcus massiliensis TaxID=1470358 RepID=UPI0004B97F58|nr:A24 family peptidase [Candidatus Blastococcus massiliensis]
MIALVALTGLGLGAGAVANQLAGAHPWAERERGSAQRAVPGPWLEVLGAALFAVVLLRFGLTAQLPAWLVFVSAGLVLAVIDLRAKLLPNRVLLPATLAVLVLLTVAAAVDDAWPDLLRAALAGAVSFGVGLVLALISPSGLGMGDVKLAALLGLVLGWLGWPVVLLGFLVGFLLQAVLGLALLAVRRAGRSTELPFGPALLAGALVAAVLSGEWIGLDPLF